MESKKIVNEKKTVVKKAVERNLDIDSIIKPVETEREIAIRLEKEIRTKLIAESEKKLRSKIEEKIKKELEEKRILREEFEKKEIVVRAAQEEERAHGRELVRGKFRNHESSGSRMKFSFRKWDGDPIVKYELVDGGIYSIPRDVALHLNRNVWYQTHKYAQTENGKPRMTAGKKIDRASFEGLEFIDMSNSDSRDLAGSPKRIIEVSY